MGSFFEAILKNLEAFKISRDTGALFLSTSKIALSTSKESSTALFENCLDSKAKEDDVMRDMGLGNNLNILGTPTFFVNDRELENWGYSRFKEALDNELAK